MKTLIWDGDDFITSGKVDTIEAKGIYLYLILLSNDFLEYCISYLPSSFLFHPRLQFTRACDYLNDFMKAFSGDLDFGERKLLIES